MEKEKKKNIPLRILNIFIFVFFIVYIVSNSGYLSSYNLNKTYLTEEEIEIFENDIKNKNPIVGSYINSNEENYTNKFSEMGENISFFINKGCKKVFNVMVDFFSYLFT